LNPPNKPLRNAAVPCSFKAIASAVENGIGA
jgi:hypothetical protein